MLKLRVNTPSISFCCLGSRFKGSLALGISRNIGDRNEEPPFIGGECDIRKGIRKQLDLHLHHLPCPHTALCNHASPFTKRRLEILHDIVRSLRLTTG